jgi:Tfp pilus assembly protein PilO
MSLTRRVFSERRTVVVPLVIFLALNVIVLAAVVYPLEQNLAGADEARTKAELALASAKKDNKDAVDARASKARADVELKKFYGEVLPKDFAAARNLTNFWLGRIAEQCKLNYRAGQYEAEEVRNSQLMKFKGDVTLVGDYADIRKFLYQVETAQEFVVIERVAMNQPNAAVQPGTQLELTVSVATYYLPSAVVSK